MAEEDSNPAPVPNENRPAPVSLGAAIMLKISNAIVDVSIIVTFQSFLRSTEDFSDFVGVMNNALRTWGVQLGPVEPEVLVEAGVFDCIIAESQLRHHDEVTSSIQHRGDHSINMYHACYDFRDSTNEMLGSYRASIVDMRIKIIHAICEADAGVRPYSDAEPAESGHIHYGVFTVADIVNELLKLSFVSFNKFAIMMKSKHCPL